MTRTWKIATGVALGVALLAGTGAAVVAAREQGPGPGGAMGRRGGPGGPGGPMGILPGLRGLDLSASQREQITTAMDAHKAEFEAQFQKAGTARKALNDAVVAETFDEGTIRQKAADLAIVEADGAVLRARVHSEVWALLTAEQQTKARAQMAQRADQVRQRMDQRRGQRAERRQKRQAL